MVCFCPNTKIIPFLASKFSFISFLWALDQCCFTEMILNLEAWPWDLASKAGGLSRQGG